MPHCAPKGFLIATALSALMAGSALAEMVTLKTIDQSFSVEGEITDFDGVNYTLQTSIGSVMVAADLVVCEGSGCPQVEAASAKLTIAGDKTLGLRLFPALLRTFGTSLGAQTRTVEADSTKMVLGFVGGGMSEDSDVTIVPTTSSEGLDALFKGETQLALSTRAVREREAQAFEEFGLGKIRETSQEMILALDALVFVTHPDNPVRAITKRDAARIFAGDITNWNQLGGRDEPINLYTREETAHAYEAMAEMIMEPAGLNITDNKTVYTADNAISGAVRNDIDGIGFISYAGIGDAQAMSIQGECGILSEPTEFAIKTEEYPLTRPLFMYQTSARLPGNAGDFRSFLGGETAQELVSDAGFVNQNVTIESVNTQGLRIASSVIANSEGENRDLMLDMVVLFATADRLSTTFRFDPQTSELNARSQADVQRLADILAGERFTKKEILFVGFTDANGDAALNQELSQQRAEQIQSTVLARNPRIATNVQMRSVGYGEISPLGCNDSEEGRTVNNRIEVWVRDVE